MKNKLFCGLCVLFLLFLSGCKQNRQVMRLQKLEEGVSSPTTIEELKDAISKYESRVQDIQLAQTQIGIWYKILGTRYVDNKMYGEALDCFKKALEFYPDNQNIHYYVGLCAGYMAKASYDFEGTGLNSRKENYLRLSEQAYLTAIQIENRYGRALYALGVLYTFGSQPGEIGLNEHQKALTYLEKYLTIETKDVQGMFVLARAYYSVYEFQKACDMYDKIISTTKSSELKSQAQALKQIVLGAMDEF